MTTDLEDDEIARLMALSDEEILAEARAEGIDTDKLAYEMAEQFKVIAKLVRERDKARALLGRSWVRNARHSRENIALRREVEWLRYHASSVLKMMDGDEPDFTKEPRDD